MRTLSSLLQRLGEKAPRSSLIFGVKEGLEVAGNEEKQEEKSLSNVRGSLRASSRILKGFQTPYCIRVRKGTDLLTQTSVWASMPVHQRPPGTSGGRVEPGLWLLGTGMQIEGRRTISCLSLALSPFPPLPWQPRRPPSPIAITLTYKLYIL